MKSACLCFKDFPLFLNDFINIHEYANYAYMIIDIHMCVCKPNHHKILAVIDKNIVFYCLLRFCGVSLNLQ